MWIVVWLIGCMEPDDAVVDRTTDPVFTEVVSWTLDRMDEWHVPGVAIGVLIDGELTHRAGLGVRRFGTNARINSNTRFRVGSISKMFTGAALLQQAEMGRIDLDAPASRALPGVTLADPLALSKPTLMQLLTHSGGMQPPGLPRRCDVDETALSGELLERAREWSLWSEPGTFFHYANPNYALGGLAVEIAADEPFAALMQRKVLAPLGMNDSGYRVEGFADDSFAWGNTLDPQTGALIEERDLTGRYCGALFPSGGLVSTIDDLSRFAAMLLNGGDPVLSPTAYQTLTGGGWRFSETSGYGLGIQSNTYYGHRALLHTGGLNGYQAIMWLFPDDGLGVIVFATVDHHVIEPPVSSSRPIHHIAEHIVQTFLDDVPIQDRPPPSFVPEKEWESRFAGRYTSEQELGEVEIIYEDGSLWMHRLDADVREQLLPYSKSSFSIPRRGSNGRTYYPTVQFIVEDEQAQHLLTSEGIATRQAR